MTARSIVTMTVLVLFALLSAQADAQTAPISLQGRLTGVPDGEQQVTLHIWAASSGGSPLGSVETTTRVIAGLFSLVAEVPQNALVWGLPSDQRWWSLDTVAGESERLPMLMVPYAHNATRLLAIDEADLVGPQRPQAYVLRGGDTNSTNLVFGSITTGARNELHILGPASPADSTNYINIDMDFASAGSAEIRAFRGSSWDTGLAFLTNPRDQGADQPQVRMVVTESGFVGINTTRPEGELDVRGLTRTSVLTITGGSDLAEPFRSSPASIEARPGMVLAIDPENPGALRVSTEAYDTKVAGVYSGGNGLPTGLLMGKDGDPLAGHGDDRLPLAMTGRVWVYADDSNGAIAPGDRLTTSGANAGYAARVDDESRAPGTVIGKAMTGIDADAGMVLVLVNLQ